MPKVNVTELRQHLPGYLQRVQRGEAIQVTLHGKVIARIVPEVDAAARARADLAHWRDAAVIGDVTSPVDASWEATHGRV